MSIPLSRVAVLLAAICTTNVAMAGHQEGNPVPKKQSDDPTYGYQEANPIKVGGGPANELRFLKSLRGPNGQ